jgi:transposase
MKGGDGKISDKLSIAYRVEEDPKVKERILMVRLYKELRSSHKVGEIFGYSHNVVLNWNRRFEKEGIRGLKDKQRGVDQKSYHPNKRGE